MRVRQVETVEELAALRPLWLALHQHHRDVRAGTPLQPDDELSWELREGSYRRWLEAGEALILVAVAGPDDSPGEGRDEGRDESRDEGRADPRADAADLDLRGGAERVVGYAVTRLHRGPDDSFDFGDPYAELYSFSVLPSWRGQHAGTLMLDELERLLVTRGITVLTVSVMEDNRRALALYTDRGFLPMEVMLWRPLTSGIGSRSPGECSL